MSEFGDGLPPLDERRPFYREACAEWTSKVPADREWNPFEVRLIEDRVQRDHQLQTSLLREKDLQQLLREARSFVSVQRFPALSARINKALKITEWDEEYGE